MGLTLRRQPAHRHHPEAPAVTKSSFYSVRFCMACHSPTLNACSKSFASKGFHLDGASILSITSDPSNAFRRTFFSSKLLILIYFCYLVNTWLSPEVGQALDMIWSCLRIHQSNFHFRYYSVTQYLASNYQELRPR